MKPQPSRPPFVLIPLLLLVGMGLIWGMAGCGLLPPEVVGMFFPPSREAASENINRAVKSLADGDLTRADYFIAEAVRGYGEPLSGGVATVARQLTRQGRAARAVQLIDSITERRPDIARSPLLLAALAEAYSKAGDNTRAAQTLQNAQKCAGEALQAARSARPPAKPEVLNAVMEAAGFWEDAAAPESGAKAIDAAREALRLLPDDPQTLNLLGYLLADKGTTPAQWRESLTLTRQALTLVQKANAAIRAGPSRLSPTRMGGPYTATGILPGRVACLPKRLRATRTRPRFTTT